MQNTIQSSASRIGDEMSRMRGDIGKYATFFEDFYVTPPIVTAAEVLTYNWSLFGTGALRSMIGQGLIGIPVNNVEGISVLQMNTGATSGNWTAISPASVIAGFPPFSSRLHLSQSEEFLLVARMGSFSANARVFVGLGNPISAFPEDSNGSIAQCGIGHFNSATVKGVVGSGASNVVVEMPAPNALYVGLAQFDTYAIQWKNRELAFYVNDVEVRRVARGRNRMEAADEALVIGVKTSTAALASMGIDYLFYSTNRVQGLV